jgi:putative (di)nucleoside polyphosphate hydrolase
MGSSDSKRLVATGEMIDTDGYRANVGIVLCNPAGQVMWARRVGQDAWQFPQGGISASESPCDAMYRELWEETGLESDHVSVLGETDSWLRYKLPKRLMRRSEPRCIGQKQMWYLLRLESDEDHFDLGASDTPEFDHWEWVDYWYPVENVVFFKRRVYQCALAQLESRLQSAVVPVSD